MALDKTVAPPAQVPPYYEEKFWRRWAWVYDPLVQLYLLPFGGEGRLRRRFINFARPRLGEQVLDVCCGTGTLTSLIARRVGKSGRVTGVDLSVDMMNRARKKAVALPVTFKQASSDHLPFPEDNFDRCFISYGLHELPEAVRWNSLKEAYRVLRPGGGLYVLDYHLPQSIPARLMIKSFVRLLEEKSVYQMMLDDTLPDEITDAGFMLKERQLPLKGMFQMIRADKPG